MISRLFIERLKLWPRTLATIGPLSANRKSVPV
jgi:hypothetical protein